MPARPVAHRCSLILIIAFLASVLAANPGHAQILSAPTVVTADGSGHFSYLLTFQAPSSGTWFGSIHVVGLVNCNQDSWVDGFCMGFLDGSVQTQYPIEGTLVDPGQDGQVQVTFDTCNPNFSGTVGTSITHTVPSEESSWSTLKADYHR